MILTNGIVFESDLVLLLGLLSTFHTRELQNAAVAGEQNPKKTAGIMIISLLLITVYVFVALALVGNVDQSVLSTDIKPIHTISNNWGDYFGYFAAAVGVIMMSMANLVFWPRLVSVCYGKDKMMPGFLGLVNSKFMTL